MWIRKLPYYSDALMITKWVLWRCLLPIAVAGVVTYSTWGDDFFTVSNSLLWTGLAVHLLVTIAYRQTHVLDTGSFAGLFVCYTWIGNVSERHGIHGSPQWIIAAVSFAAYLLFSLVGRRRATRGEIMGSDRPISATEIVLALALLVVAIPICASSKEGVGFLLVPGMIFVPAVLLYALFKRGRKR